MMRLSSYVSDPLMTKSKTWVQPITRARVHMSEELKSRLPEIMQIDLTKEARGPREILHQLIAAQLRDLGFLIAADFAGTEEESLAFHRLPLLPESGFFGSPVVGYAQSPFLSQVAFLSLGASSGLDEHKDVFARLRFLSRDFHKNLESSPTYFADFKGRTIEPTSELAHHAADLGHICTAGLSPAQIGKKLQDFLPDPRRGILPVVFVDSPEAVTPLLRDSRLWPDPANPNCLGLWVFDHKLRLGQGLEPDIERKMPICEESLFAHLEVLKTKHDIQDVYFGLPRHVKTSAHRKILEAFIDSNQIFTREDVATASLHEQIARIGTIFGNRVVLIHGDMFTSELPRSQKTLMCDLLRQLKSKDQLKGVIVWGISAERLKEWDVDIFEQFSRVLLQKKEKTLDLKGDLL